MIFLPRSFNGPTSYHTIAAALIVLAGIAVVLPSKKHYTTCLLYIWLFLAAGVVVSLLLYGSLYRLIKNVGLKMVGMTRKVAGIIRRIIYRRPKDWEDDLHEYGV